MKQDQFWLFLMESENSIIITNMPHIFVYMYTLVTLQDFERSRAFSFLNEVKKRFQTTYGSRAQTALPYAMNSEFSSVLAAQLVIFFSGHSVLICIFFFITFKHDEYSCPNL